MDSGSDQPQCLHQQINYQDGTRETAATLGSLKNTDLTLTVEFPDDRVQEGVLRSHMAPPDRHLRWKLHKTFIEYKNDAAIPSARRSAWNLAFVIRLTKSSPHKFGSGGQENGARSRGKVEERVAVDRRRTAEPNPPVSRLR